MSSRSRIPKKKTTKKLYALVFFRLLPSLHEAQRGSRKNYACLRDSTKETP